jgi:hypothetical protein
LNAKEEERLMRQERDQLRVAKVTLETRYAALEGLYEGMRADSVSQGLLTVQPARVTKLQHTTLYKKALLNLTIAGGRSLSTAFLTGFEVILYFWISMIVLSAGQVLHHSFAGMAPRAAAKASAARVAAAGQLEPFAFLLSLLRSVLALLFVRFLLLRSVLAILFVRFLRVIMNPFRFSVFITTIFGCDAFIFSRSCLGLKKSAYSAG